MQNRASFTDSQNLFIAVAVGSVVLALLLGYALALSLTGPIRQMEARLEAIASGDFSGHVGVANRDELGALAANINRMNDELGRLYSELETASRHKSDSIMEFSSDRATSLGSFSSKPRSTFCIASANSSAVTPRRPNSLLK